MLAKTDQISDEIDELKGLKKSKLSFGRCSYSSPHFSPEREARADRCPEIQGTRETKCAGVIYSTSSPLSERNAVDSGRCAPASAGW